MTRPPCAVRIVVGLLTAAASWALAVGAAAQEGLSLLSINSPSVAEGDSGSASLTFTVTLTPPVGSAVTVNYAASTGTATSGTDYTASSGTLTFASGETSKTITVSVTGDTTDEPDETVVVQLSGAVNAGYDTATGTGTITDDDPAPTVTLALSRSSIAESGATNSAAVTASLNHASSATTTVTVSAAAGANAASGDFSLSSNTTLTIAAGSTSSTGSVTITANDNTQVAANKSVTVSGSASNSQGITQPSSVTLTITEDDQPEPGNRPPEITTPGDRTYAQGATITPFAIAVSDPDGDAVTVDVTGLPSGLRHAAGRIEGTVASDAAAQAYTVTITATDGAAPAVEATFTITVTAPPPPPSPPEPGNRPPEITTPGDRTYAQGATITPFAIAVSDPDGDAVTVDVTGLPSGLRHAAGQVEGTVDPDAAAQAYAVTITATDGTAPAVEATFTITVTERDRKPTFGSASVPAQRYQVGLEIDPLTLPEATGGDGPLRYALTPAPPAPGLVYTAPDADASTGGVIAGTPTAAQTAVRCTLTATDADGDTATLTFAMTVAEDPTPVPAIPLVGQGLLAAFLLGLGAWFQRRRR